MFALSSPPSSFTAGAPVTPRERIAKATRLIGAFAWLIALLAALPTQAAVFSVGVGAECTHTTIQAAINAAQDNPGADTVRITRSLFYIEQALVLSTAQEVDLVGGFATCKQAASDGVLTDVSGINGAEEPVMRITINSGGLVRLRHLTILRGDEDGAGNGGGIFFRGNGSLQISDSAINDNIAGYGGGIYAEGTGPNAELIIGANVFIGLNTARYSGGGIYVSGMEMAMREQGSVIAFNTAQGANDSGFGGGLTVLSRGNLLARAYIGGGGFGTGTIFGNTARYGGGVAIVVADGARPSDTAELQLFTTQADRRAMIRQNTASVVGGGVYLKGSGGLLTSYVDASAVFFNADIVDNRSPDGAAAYIDHRGHLRMRLLAGTAPDGALPCPINQPCGRITGNQAQNAAQQPTVGAVIRNEYALDINGRFGFNETPSGGVLISGNRGGRLIHSINGFQMLNNALIVNNDVSLQLFQAVENDCEIDSTTIAGNTVGGAQVFGVTCTGSPVAVPYIPTGIAERNDVQRPLGAISVFNFYDIQPNGGISYTISGNVQADGANLAGARVVLNNSELGQTTTDANGNYLFKVNENFSQTVSIYKNGYNFNPAFRFFSNVQSNQTANFQNGTLLCVPAPAGQSGANFCQTAVGTSASTIQNGKIAFERFNHTFIMDADGGNQAQLAGASYSPAWSPDGTRLSFSWFNSGFPMEQEVYRINANGSGRTRLTNNFRPDFGASWSPDGVRLVFVRNITNLEILTMNAADGLEEIRLTDNDSEDYSPSFSPDGTKIVFASNRAGGGGSSEIYVMNANGSQQTRLTFDGPFASNNSPAWSPDGERIVFSSRGRQIWRMTATGGNIISLTNDPNAIHAAPTYSPDGTRIAFSKANQLELSDIYTMNATDGSAVTNLTNHVAGNDQSASWQKVRGSVGVTLAGNLNLTFTNVTVGGNTVATPLSPASAGALPTDFRFIPQSVAYDVRTSASFSGNIEICFNVPNVNDETFFNSLVVFHNEDGVLLDRTTSRDFSARKICATTTNLSPFVVAALWQQSISEAIFANGFE